MPSEFANWALTVYGLLMTSSGRMLRIAHTKNSDATSPNHTRFTTVRLLIWPPPSSASMSSALAPFVRSQARSQLLAPVRGGVLGLRPQPHVDLGEVLGDDLGEVVDERVEPVDHPAE